MVLSVLSLYSISSSATKYKCCAARRSVSLLVELVLTSTKQKYLLLPAAIQISNTGHKSERSQDKSVVDVKKDKRSKKLKVFSVSESR